MKKGQSKKTKPPKPSAKFIYEDIVQIVQGFYKGRVGSIIDIFQGWNYEDEKWEEKYLVFIDSITDSVRIIPDEIEIFTKETKKNGKESKADQKAG